MKARLSILLCFLLIRFVVLAQNQTAAVQSVSLSGPRFHLNSNFIDAAINSINTFNSLVKKETYRTKVASFNNPTSSDMGFNLENEIQTALKPLLAKAKNTNTTKFSQVVSTLVAMPQRTGTTAVRGAVAPPINPIYATLLSVVGNLAIQEKKVTREDLDSFITTTSKYFVQYEKLHNANQLFDQNLDRLDSRLKELQFDLKEYLLDMVGILHKGVQRATLKNMNNEELFLKYLDTAQIERIMQSSQQNVVYPADGIKTAKDITHTLQKLFAEYQKVYGDNYQQIRTILNESRSLGKNINTRQVEASLKELELLYNDSKTSDVLSLRLNTLNERLKVLVDAEQKREM